MFNKCVLVINMTFKLQASENSKHDQQDVTGWAVSGYAIS